MLPQVRGWLARSSRWLCDAAASVLGAVVRPVARAVREMYETQVWFDEEGDKELRRVMAERRLAEPRRRGLLRSRRLAAAIAAGGRLAALLGLVFPVAFAVGWLFQAGQLLGYGVPLALVTPDPVHLAVSAATVTLLLAAVLGGMFAINAAYARMGARWRARIYFVQLPVSLAFALLLLLGVDFGVDVVLVVGAYYMFVLQPLLMASTYRRIFSLRVLGTLALVVLLLAPGPLGWAMAQESARDDAPGEWTVIVDGELPGMEGLRVSGGCAHEGLMLLQLDQSRAVLHRPGESTVWVVPEGSLVSIAMRAPPVDGPPC